MAGVPCINDSCSITGSVDGSGRLTLSANLDPAGGILCGTDADPNSGLRIALHGDPAATAVASLSACDNLLGVTSDNKLFARRPEYELFDVSGALQDWISGTDSDESTNFTITNSDQCSRLVILRTRFQFAYETDNSIEYETDGTFVIERNGSPLSTHSIAIGGPICGAAGTDFHVRNDSTVDFFTIGAGANVTITTYGTNRSTCGFANGAGGDNGFRAFHSVLMLDLAAGDLFT